MYATAPTQIIEGDFRVVSTRALPVRRKSPNRRRAVARIVFWNAAMVLAVTAVPYLFL